MSDYTNIEFTYSEEPPDFGVVLDRVRSFLVVRHAQRAG